MPLWRSLVFQAAVSVTVQQDNMLQVLADTVDSILLNVSIDYIVLVLA